MAVWTASGTALVLVSATSIQDLYRTPEQLASYGELVRDNAAVIVQSGPGYGLDPPTLGAVLVNETSIWMTVLVALMAILTVVRHTRAEEQSARAELLRAAPVGRHAASVAAVSGALATSALIGVAVAIGLVATGYGPVGSAAFGIGLVATGALFAGVGLVAAQVASTSRIATGLGLLVLAASFVVRAVGDVGSGTLSWASPIGWVQALRPFADERWWVLGLLVGATAGLLALAAWLTTRRDFGGGLLAQRPGRPGASRWLRTPLGLAVRLHRGPIVAWAFGVASLGLLYGFVAKEAEQMLEDNPDLGEFLAAMGGASITDAFLATATSMTALLAAGYLVAAVGRLHAEEAAGRAEPILATRTSRSRWVGSHVAAASTGALVVLVSGGLATGVGATVSTGEGERVRQLVGASLALAPGVAVLGAVALAVWAVAPRRTVLGWLGVAVAATVSLFAEVLDLPSSVRGLSPFHHLPALPAEAFSLAPVLAVTGVAAVLVALAFVAFARRDLAAG
jgi:ABC-2 type transport system permease protein